jgi:hypothetical protein
VPHTLKTYEKSAWNKFYVFDVWENEYMPYDVYSPLLKCFKIDFIPPICIIQNPTREQLIAQFEKATFLVEDGKGTGEGIVIKNYAYYNKYGRKTWAKMVRNEFKAQFGESTPTEIKGKKTFEEEIVKKYITDSLIDKVYVKITESEPWQSKLIPRLLNTVYHDLISEEAWNFIKEFKNPEIDFKRLMNFTFLTIKKHKSELF